METRVVFDLLRHQIVNFLLMLFNLLPQLLPRGMNGMDKIRLYSNEVNGFGVLIFRRPFIGYWPDTGYGKLPW